MAFVDVVGYSAMMARDEHGTHSRWMAVFKGVIQPAIERFQAELVKSTGDGVLVLFQRTDDAVTWSSAVQEDTSALNAQDSASNLRIFLRISLHCGSVIREVEDVYGDTVNIAARLQQFAPPGGVIVSNAVFQKLASKLEIPARNLGLLPLRNMTKPVKAYLLRFGQVEQPSRTVASMGTLPSIAVLPFQNMNGSLDDDYFCDGVVEDIVISLANLRELVVISRASTLSFGREKPDFQSLGASLGVQYVLGGALRRGPQGIAMSAELVEAETGETLWVDKFKGKLDEIFDIQDEIVERVVSGIAPTVRTREMRRALRKRPDTYSAYENTLRALDIIGNLDIDTFGEARAYLERAIDADPSFAMAYAWAARSRSIQIGQGWSQDRAQDAQEALELAKRAIDLDPDNALALATFGHLRSFLFHDYDGAVVHLERARAASPNSAYAWIVSSATESYLGRGDAAIGMAERSIRLYPKGRELFYYYNFFSIAHYVAGNYEESLRWARMSEIEHPLFTSNMRMLCASLAAVGDFRAAHQIADRLIAVEPNFTLDDYEVGRMPFKPDGLRAGFLEHLRSAGLAV